MRIVQGFEPDIVEIKGLYNFFRNQASKKSLFQEALSAIEALSVDDQAALLNIVNNRLRLRQRQQVEQELKEV